MGIISQDNAYILKKEEHTVDCEWKHQYRVAESERLELIRDIQRLKNQVVEINNKLKNKLSSDEIRIIVRDVEVDEAVRFRNHQLTEINMRLDERNDEISELKGVLHDKDLAMSLVMDEIEANRELQVLYGKVKVARAESERWHKKRDYVYSEVTKLQVRYDSLVASYNLCVNDYEEKKKEIKDLNTQIKVLRKSGKPVWADPKPLRKGMKMSSGSRLSMFGGWADKLLWWKQR